MKNMQRAIAHYQKIGVTPGQNKCHEEMIYGLALMHTSIHEAIGADLRKYDLTPTEMNVLMLVKHQGESPGLAQKNIGKRLMVTAHNLTRLIQRLERSGLLRRSAYARDARANLIRITSKGSELLDEIWPHYDQKVKDLAAVLPPKDQAHMARLIQQWLDAYKSDGKIRSPSHDE